MKARVMKLLSFTLALLAAVGIVVQPVAPAYAARWDGLLANSQARVELREQRAILAGKTGQTLDELILDAQISASIREKLAGYAAQGEAAILSRAQIDELAQTHPALYAKLMRAYRTASTPNLTAEEKKLVDQLTAVNIEAFKAGVFPMGCVPPIGAARQLGTAVASAGSLQLAATSEPCPSNISNNTTSAFVIVGLLLTVIVVVPLFCAIAARFGTAPSFCP